MVRKYYPLLRWLEEPDRLTADGRRRLEFVAADARQFIRRQAADSYDVVVLDAYTSGSTIPPHLMTREFYAEIAGASAPRRHRVIKHYR